MSPVLPPRGGRPRPALSGIALAALLPVLAGGPASAQEAPRRGFWFAAGTGVGRTLSDDAFVGGSWAGYMRAGGTVSPHLLVGGEVLWVLGADAQGGEFPVGRAGLLATGLFYPRERGGFFLKGGIGYTGRNETFALATDAGVGFDLRLSGNFHLTPEVDLLLVSGDGGSVSHLAFTVGLTWH